MNKANDVFGLTDERAMEIMVILNEVYQSVIGGTVQELIVRLNLPKYKIREQRFMCYITGNMVEHGLVKHTINNLHSGDKGIKEVPQVPPTRMAGKQQK